MSNIALAIEQAENAGFHVALSGGSFLFVGEGPLAEETEAWFRERESDVVRYLDRGDDGGTNGIEPIDVCDLIRFYPDLRLPIINGLLRRGETMNIIASPKIGKSFLAGGLAWSIATGGYWLGYETTKGKVLIIDNELHPETLSSRLSRIAIAMQVHAESGMIDVLPLRGLSQDIHELRCHLDTIPSGTYALVVLDALYRTLPERTSENDNAAMMAVFNRLDYYAAKLDCAVAVVHHSSKGDQAEKGLTDVGSGAGAISRAADTHLIIRPHEEPGHAVLEAVTRSFKSPEPVTIQWEYPLWHATTLAPAIKRRKSETDAKLVANDSEADRNLLEVLNAGSWKSDRQIRRLTGWGETRCNRAIVRALTAESIVKRTVKRQGRKVVVYSLSGPLSGPREF